MRRKPSRIALGALLLPILLLLAAPRAAALGSRENPLAVADELIKAQEYNRAIDVLRQYIQANPAGLDLAQRRLNRIAAVQSDFNKTAKELLTAFVDEPAAAEKHARLIQRLRDLIPKPGETEKSFIQYAERTSIKVLWDQQRLGILQEAADQAARGLYVESARTNTRGFTLYRQQFDQDFRGKVALGVVTEGGESGKDGVDRAFETVAEAERQIGRFAELQAELASALPPLSSAFDSGDPARVDAALPAAEAALTRLAGIRAETLDTGRFLENLSLLFKEKDPGLENDFFVPFAASFILGRPQAERLEGVAGSMAAQWAALFDSAAGAADAALARKAAYAQAAFSEGRFPDSDSGFRSVPPLADRAIRFQRLWSLFLPTDVTDPPSAFGRTIVSVRGSDYLRLQHLRDTAQASAALAALRTELAAQEARERELTAALDAALAAAPSGPGSPEAALADGLTVLRGLRTRTAELRKGISDLDAAARTRGAELARLSGAGGAPRGSQEVQTALEDRLTRSSEAAAAFELRTVALAAKAETDVQEYRLKSRTADIAAARRLAEGAVPEGAPQGTAPLAYPTRSLQVIAESERLLQVLRRDVAGILSRYSAEPASFSSAPAVTAQLERARALDAAAARLSAEGQTLAAAARDRQRQAQSNRLEADRRLAEARAAYGREDFDTARERLERARERYLASLSFEDDPALRAKSDLDLQNLGTQIVQAENERVVRDTRRLLTEGKALYNAGDFARAEEALLQARARWRVTHTDEPEPEVENWLRLVQTALSVKTGRDIPQTAPLYPEMSQLLSLARRNYEDGRAALERRDRVSALQSFETAKQRIAQVKLVFPLNQEARVLELRINQVSDPDAFNREFARLVSQARSKIDARQDLETVYSDLLDLQTIDPKYTGLAALIERLEILIGLRLPPPDPRALAEARTLTTAAQRIWDARNVSQFSIALTQLNRALELDPNNQSASALKDRILTYVGGTAVVVLPSAGETLYNEAVGFLQTGDFLNARIRLTRLYETYPQARKVQKVSDLDSRLVARGY
ncbi:MAG TPA: hypothetical protein P5117_04345 [Spirochaetia bacterium]|nr:hypothetical protein [Spirochaetia bacterium]HRZ88696.1 hypothetical protein [Spirochaetia bacterium]